MPILLKRIEASVISLFGDATSNNFTAPVTLLQQFVGTVGDEDYIKLTVYEAFTQDFSSVGEAEFCTTPTSFGLGECTSYTNLNISY
jgi:hypothetical protein